MTCNNCRFWEERKAAKPNGEPKQVQGHCHRYPAVATGNFVPQVNKITQQVQPQLIETTVWPLTNSNGWCGEFEERKE